MKLTKEQIGEMVRFSIVGVLIYGHPLRCLLAAPVGYQCEYCLDGRLHCGLCI